MMNLFIPFFFVCLKLARALTTLHNDLAAHGEPKEMGYRPRPLVKQIYIYNYIYKYVYI